MRVLLRELLDLLLPPTCASCRRDAPVGAALCPGCDARIPRIPAERCPLCQERGARRGGPCEPCAARGGPLDTCLAAARFEGEAARWIRRFKYAGKGLAGLDPAPGAVAAALVREAAGRLGDAPPDVVIPVPAHPRRLRRRGFDPAATLAGAAAQACGAPLDASGLRRIRDTPSQTGLLIEARRRNVAGAFTASRPPGARVWLVDDVVTTGATLGEAARVLRAAGAREIHAVCAARTPRVEGPWANG